jgi:hypothetical protein
LQDAYAALKRRSSTVAHAVVAHAVVTDAVVTECHSGVRRPGQLLGYGRRTQAMDYAGGIYSADGGQFRSLRRLRSRAGNEIRPALDLLAVPAFIH